MAVQKSELKLGGELIARVQPRHANQRAEDRLEDVIDRAVISFRGQDYIVPVLNISSRGTMVECEIQPRIGETITIQFQDCARIQSFVRWVRQGRLGLNFGHEIILC